MFEISVWITISNMKPLLGFEGTLLGSYKTARAHQAQDEAVTINNAHRLS